MDLDPQHDWQVRIDIALIQVSPPDRLGFVSLGVSVDIVRAAVDTADLILAEVNPNIPRPETSIEETNHA